jgi:hypothetical protein
MLAPFQHSDPEFYLPLAMDCDTVPPIPVGRAKFLG